MTNTDEAYRISRTGFTGNDALIAIALDEIYMQLITDRPYYFDVWAINDAGNYRVAWSRDGVLLNSEGINVTVASVMGSVREIADQILSESDALG